MASTLPGANFFFHTRKFTERRKDETMKRMLTFMLVLVGVLSLISMSMAERSGKKEKEEDKPYSSIKNAAGYQIRHGEQAWMPVGGKGLYCSLFLVQTKEKTQQLLGYMNGLKQNEREEVEAMIPPDVGRIVGIRFKIDGRYYIYFEKLPGVYLIQAVAVPRLVGLARVPSSRGRDSIIVTRNCDCLGKVFDKEELKRSFQ
ncbi:MAG: hypothetical protein V1690_02495 [Candidatus Moraniibacteriota bacterium]